MYSQSDVEGKVVDSDELPVEFANIIALSLPDSTIVKGTMTGLNGR